MPKFGYFILRDEDRTIAAGKILRYKVYKSSFNNDNDVESVSDDNEENFNQDAHP